MASGDPAESDDLAWWLQIKRGEEMSAVPEARERSNGRHELVRARQRMLVDGLDYRRVLKGARGTMTQVQMAEVLGISQPAVAKALKAAEGTPDVLANFSGASVMEVCQRFAAGLIDHDRVVHELVSWPYVDEGSFDEFGEYTGPESGTVDDLSVARGLGLIDDGVYADVLQGLAGREVPRT